MRDLIGFSHQFVSYRNYCCLGGLPHLVPHLMMLSILGELKQDRVLCI